MDHCQCYSNEISTDSPANLGMVGSTAGGGSNTTTEIEANPDHLPNHRELFSQMKQLMISELQSIKQIRNSEEEMQETLKERKTEEQAHKLEVSIYDTKRNVKAATRRQELERLAKEDAERRNDTSMDYLAPFLAKMGLDNNDPDLAKQIDVEMAKKLNAAKVSTTKNKVTITTNLRRKNTSIFARIVLFGFIFWRRDWRSIRRLGRIGIIFWS